MNRVGWWATANDYRQSNVTQIPPDEQQQLLLRLFAGWYEPVLELIACTPHESIVMSPSFDRLATRKWGTGSVTMLGDAVHPTTPNLGQGGCMAIEDAAILARCLHKYGAADAGLRAYEEIRYPRTKAVASYSRIYGRVGQWQSPWATHLRSVALSLVPQAVTQTLLGRIFDYDAYGVIIQSP
jgi:2-polyprenyl-6-methoxyphenol hydroxylase-like FAD-dependent oxidoreductase